MSKLDVTDAYHRICINLVLPMGWVDSPKFFCAFSETLTDVANALVDADLPVPAYGAISALPATEPPPPPHFGKPHSYRLLYG